MVDFNEDRIFFGARSAAVANRVFILHTTPFSSALICPPELTSDGSGFLAYPSGREQTVEVSFDGSHVTPLRTGDRIRCCWTTCWAATVCPIIGIYWKNSKRGDLCHGYAAANVGVYGVL